MATVNDLYKVTLSYTTPNASVAQNVFYYQLVNADCTDLELRNAVEDWVNDFWGPGWALLAGENAELVSMDIDQMFSDGTVNQNVTSVAIGISGDLVTGQAIAAVSGYLLAQTLQPKQRGSKYVPFIAEAAINDGILTTGATADLGALLILYLADLVVAGAATLTPGIISRTLVEFVPFLAQGTVNDVPCYQRRRKPNVGS